MTPADQKNDEQSEIDEKAKAAAAQEEDDDGEASDEAAKDVDDTESDGDDSDSDDEGDEEPKQKRSLLEILRDIISSPKSKHEGHYQVKVSDEHLAEAHDAIADAAKEDEAA